MAIDIGEFNPFSGGFGGMGSGSFAQIMAAFAVILIIIIGFGALLFMFLNSKRYYIIIELYKNVDGQTRMIKKYRAREHKIGKAGDILWYVGKVSKYIAPGTIQSGPNIYKYYERYDGEWINFHIGNVDEQMRSAGVVYIENDMRAQRIAISKSLESELKEMNFWQKYGATITFILEILIFGVACVIIFYQFSEVVTQMDLVVANMDRLTQSVSHLYGNLTKQPIYNLPNL